MENSPSSKDLPPSYTDSMNASSSVLIDAQPIHSEQRSANRTSIISALLTTQIVPHLQECALKGLSKSTMLLIPSNNKSLQPPSSGDNKESLVSAFPGEIVVDFPSTENIHLVRLRGVENTLEFWHQQPVLNQLERQLKVWFLQGRYTLFGERNQDVQPGSDRELNSRQLDTGIYTRPDWRYAEEQIIEDGEVRLGVEMREVCLRIENEMGLYETRTGKAVVVRVQLGG